MNRTFKIILIVSLILNMAFLGGLVFIGVKANSYYHLIKGDHHDRDGHRKWGKNKNHKKIFSSLRENQQIREEIDQMKILKEEVGEVLDSDEELSMERIEGFLNRVQDSVLNITEATHEDLVKNLEQMSAEERKESIKFFFRRRF